MTRVFVRLTLAPTSEGGRRKPIVPPTYHCPVFFDGIPPLSERGCDCRILVVDHGGPISPGETVEVIPMVFLSESEVLPHIFPGVRFRLWEGRTIGSGEVLCIEEKCALYTEP